MDFNQTQPDKPWEWKNISLNIFGWKYDDIKQYWEQRKQKVFEKNGIIKEELLACAWHPERMMNWCLDIQERKRIEMDWKFC